MRHARHIRGRRVMLAAVACAAAAFAAVLGAGATHGAHRAVARTATADPQLLARWSERAPHVASAATVVGERSAAQPAPAADLAPVPAVALRAPIAHYRAYAERRLAAMAVAVQALRGALTGGDRAAAQADWRAAEADYQSLGAVYLSGRLGAFDQAIDGSPGRLPGGTASPRFTGLHRLELGLWRGAAPSSLAAPAARLGRDVAAMRRALPRAAVSPADYATRAHEILEDAVRDQLSGAAAPWSGAGLLATAAGVRATSEIVRTLEPVLGGRGGVRPVVDADLAQLRAVLAAIRRAHGGALPPLPALTQAQSERLDAAVGQALEGLAQVPGALETGRAAAPPAIPASAVRIDP